VPRSPENLETLLQRCLPADRRRLAPRLAGTRRGTPGHASEPLPDALRREIERAVEHRDRREAGLPKPSYPIELPVVARKDEIAAAIRDHQAVVICGETGSGKTTQIPKICLELGRGVMGMIGHTQPRRIAARSVASRIAEELRTPLGRAVGYKVRFGDQTSEDTYIKLMTDGILLAETQRDRLLESYDTLIIDEAHERSLNIDFLLGYLKRLLPRRPDLKVIVTSATIDPARFAAHFAGPRGPAPIIEVSGRTYPVEVRYLPRSGDEDDADLTQEDGIVAAVDDLCALDPGGRGDVLVFLATEREIRETAEVLRKHHPPGTEILPLYARLSAQEQMRVFRPHPGRRIVLATNVAETSLTVPGIRYVVDPGYARISRYSARTKVQRLPIEAVSRASADQRAGRCGRVEAGVCIRLYAQEDYAARERFTEPEILRTNLASVILQMKALRLGSVDDFPFVEPPDSRMIKDGYETLRELGAVDDRHELTRVGAELARLPIDPRLGRMILAAEKEHCLAEVLIIAAALSVQDPRERPLERQEAADQAHRQFRDENSDFVTYLNLWKFYHEQSRHMGGSKLRKLCRDSFLSFTRMREWHDVRQQLHAQLTEMGKRVNTAPADTASIHRAVLAGLLSNIGRKDPETPEYAGTRGTKFYIFPGSGLFKQGPKWVMAGEVVTTTRAYARTVARIDPAAIEQVGAHALTRNHTDPHWNAQSGQVFAHERITLFGLELVARRRVSYGKIDPSAAREIFIQHALVEGDLRTEGAFLIHNRAVLEHARLVEAKARRTDLVADARKRFAFYDSRVPPDVFDSHRFEHWRKAAERRDPRVLYMTDKDALAGLPPEITPDRFPDSIEFGGASLALTYAHDPAAPTDGLTMHVPVAALGHLDVRSGEKLVPGMLREKVEAVIKTLPRATRKYISAELLARCVNAVERSRAADGSMLDVLARELTGALALEVTPASFRSQDLPPHLRMNFRILDAAGARLGEGRDLSALQRELGESVRAGFGALAPREYDRRDLRDWDFGDLPDKVTLSRGGVTLHAHPALADEGGTVCLRLFETPERAAEAMREGLRALFLARAADEVRHHVRLMEHLPRMSLRYAAAAPGRAITRDLSLLVAERSFVTGEPVRDRLSFEAALLAGWSRIARSARDVERDVAPVLEALHRAQVCLAEAGAPAFADAAADIGSQLVELTRDGFLIHTPRDRFTHVARYVGAVEVRLSRLANAGLERDSRAMLQVLPHWRRFLERAREHEATGRRDPALERYRWMIEEMRVSLFAQHLGTAEPVSLKRLDDQWALVKQ